MKSLLVCYTYVLFHVRFR